LYPPDAVACAAGASNIVDVPALLLSKAHERSTKQFRREQPEVWQPHLRLAGEHR
jgi:hypothetical protein